MARIATQLPDEVKRKLDSLKQPKETTAELLARLIGAQEQLAVLTGLNLTPAEQQEVKEAIEKSGLSFVELAQQGLLTRARAVKSFADKLNQIDLNDKNQRFAGVAAARIHQKVQELMLRGEPITQRIITKETRANLKAIKAYLQQNQPALDAHNKRLAKAK